MDWVPPLAPMYQAGTPSENPLAMAAGLATLRHLKAHPEIYARLDSLSAKLVAGVLAVAKKEGATMTANRVGSMFTWVFTPGPVHDWDSASKCDAAAFGKFFRRMLDNGVYLPPGQNEAALL